MLSVIIYDKHYVDACRARVRDQLAAYDGVMSQFDTSSAKQAVRFFDAHFFGNLVVALDRYFLHRARTPAGKEVGPCDEVRALCDSILQHDGILTIDETMKYDPEKSVLNIKAGDRILLNEFRYRRLSEALFAEIEAKYTVGQEP